MKIRSGFVSNSSSTSFCVHGLYLDYDKIIELLAEKNSEAFIAMKEKIIKYLEEDLKECGHKQEIQECIDSIKEGDIKAIINAIHDDGTLDDITEICDNGCLSSYVGEEGAVIGRSYCTMEQDETREEFEAKAEKEIKSLLGDSVKCEFMNDAISN